MVVLFPFAKKKVGGYFQQKGLKKSERILKSIYIEEPA